MMYQTQLINLLREFTFESNQHYNFSRLLSDTDYRNQCLSATPANNDKLNLIVKQVRTLEDLLDHQFQVDVTGSKIQSCKSTQTLENKQSSRKQRFGMAALALSGLLFIAASVTVVEEVKYQRAINLSNQIQAD